MSSNYYRVSYYYEENDFTKVFKNVVRTDLEIILLRHQNNYVGISSIMSNAAKSFDILATSLFVPHNYFNDLTKLFLLYLNFYI